MLLGPTIPCLIELFFASHARAWLWRPAAARQVGDETSAQGCAVGFHASGYLPGPAAMRHISLAGRAPLRSLLLEGVPLERAVDLGLISPLSLAAPGAAAGDEGAHAELAKALSAEARSTAEMLVGGDARAADESEFCTDGPPGLDAKSSGGNAACMRRSNGSRTGESSAQDSSFSRAQSEILRLLQGVS